MKKLVIAGLILASLYGCSNSDHAQKALTKAGFSDIQTTGYSWFACSEDDFYSTGFRAKNSKGEVVEGTVCSGLFLKGSTIRF